MTTFFANQIQENLVVTYPLFTIKYGYYAYVVNILVKPTLLFTEQYTTLGELLTKCIALKFNVIPIHEYITQLQFKSLGLPGFETCINRFNPTFEGLKNNPSLMVENPWLHDFRSIYQQTSTNVSGGEVTQTVTNNTPDINIENPWSADQMDERMMPSLARGTLRGAMGRVLAVAWPSISLDGLMRHLQLILTLSLIWVNLPSFQSKMESRKSKKV